MSGARAPVSANPYTPPLAPLEVMSREALESQFPDASGGKRFLNYLIDQFAIMGFGMVVGTAIGLAEHIGLVTGWLDRMVKFGGVENMLFGAVLGLVYYMCLEGLFGRTVGKFVTGTKVITVEGEKPRFLQLVGRCLARWIPFEPFSFLGNAGWHDSLSSTRVVDLRDEAGRDAMSRLSPQLAKLYRK